MAEFIEHSSCPKCGSKDNLGNYNDGSCYCFGCGYYRAGSESGSRSIKDIRKLIEATQNDPKGLPYDVTNNLPEAPLKWLKGYGLTNKEIENYEYLWSASRGMLILPVYTDDGDLVLWQGRNFPATSGRKYYTASSTNNHVCVFGSHSDGVVLVEDFVSAIKCARVISAVPILGSHINSTLARRLSRYYNKMYIWLDPDKKKEMLKFKKNFEVLFTKGIEIVFSEKDPKDYSTQEIKEFLNKG